MKNQSKSSTNMLRKFVFWAASIALLATLVVIILEKTHVTNVYTKPISSIKTTDSSGPTNTIDYPIITKPGDSPDSKQSGTDKPIIGNSLTGVFNYKSITDSTLVLRVTINQIVNEGSCKLVLTRASDGKRVLKSAEIISNPSSATCKGFNIPLSELGTGRWNISVSLLGSNKSGEIMDEVTI